MPVVDLQRPNLALSLLQSLLIREGLSCTVNYANLEFAERIGVDRYQSLTWGTRAWHTLFYGEALFRASAFPHSEFDLEAFLSYATNGQVLPEMRRAFLELQRLAGDLITDLADQIVAQRPKIVGCTSTFQQHLPSLALLKRVRDLDPTIVTMMGGANCETVMGVATHRNFGWVDYLVSGEADALVGPLCRTLVQQGHLSQPYPAGLLAPIHRQQGYPANSRATFNDLESLPYPDFTDYFQQLEAGRLAPGIRVGLPLETSRGCWWGAKHHCTFCGLNGGGMAFRRKSPQRALDEIEWLARRWNIHDLEVVDNILDLRYLDTVVPHLAASPQDWNLFYEVKSNLRPEQMKAMADAGIRALQPGIESLDSRVLNLMDKGAKGWQQVQFLKFAREYGIQVSWNLLYDFPGEHDEWYREMAQIMPLLVHLQPPSAAVQIRIDRFSPYFERATDYNLTLQAHPMMGLLYPVSPDQAFDLGYHFQRSGAPVPDGPGVVAVISATQQWREHFFSPQSPQLQMTRLGDELHLLDTRPCAVQKNTVLRGQDMEVYLACSQASADRDLPTHSLERLRQARLLLTLDDRHLALALSPQAPAVPYFTPFPGGEVKPEQLPPANRVPRGGSFERMFFQPALASSS